MRRIAGVVGAMALAILLATAAPAALAASPTIPDSDRVLMAFSGDLDVPAGELADAVIVVDGDVTIGGQVRGLVVVGGDAVLRDATVDSILVVGGSVALEGSTVVLGDIRSLESTVGQADTAVVEGAIKGLDAELLMLGAAMLPALFLFAVGLAIAAVVAALLVAGLAPRQVRAAERLIVHEPGWTFVVGLLAAILTPVLGVLAIVTIVGAPLGISVLIAVGPAVAFAGYLVAAIFLGERLLYGGRESTAERPYKAAVVGVLVLQVVGLVPGIGGLVAGVASLFGFGAVILLAWRTLRGRDSGETPVTHGAPMPIGA